ncbi:hypothetical protein [Paludisphaera rhizosphaerae]|uniref:hypothetical protein n=1 Tax=Paludisphaera rhizosphaerae TaxID=2711216 RepID=UPI0013ED426A|nr:hypothetical protein [Paludisphaera rhizosphaerae]
MAGDERRGDKWTFDKRIPIIPAVLLIAQAIGFVVYAAKLEGRVVTLEEKSLKNEPLIEKVVRLDEKVVGLEKQGDRILQKLDKVIEKGH